MPCGPCNLAQRVAGLLKNYIPRNAQMGAVLGLAGQHLHIQPRALPSIDLEYSQVYLRPQKSTLSLVLAIRPHALRHPHASALQRDTKAQSWKWVPEYMADPTTKHVE